MKSKRKESLDRCACFKGNSEFHKVAELSNAGVIIYHTSKILDSEESVSAVSNNSDYAFIFHNTKDDIIPVADCMPDIENQEISCPRCRRLLEHAQEIMQDLPAFKMNDIVGICNHCRTKIKRDKSCCECRNIIRKFIKSEVCEPATCKIWLDQIKKLITEDKTPPLRKEKPLRTSSALHLEELCKEKIPKHELEIKDFYSDTYLSDSLSTRNAVDVRKKRIKLGKRKSSNMLIDSETIIKIEKPLEKRNIAKDKVNESESLLDLEKPLTHLGDTEIQRRRDITNERPQLTESEEFTNIKAEVHDREEKGKKQVDEHVDASKLKYLKKLTESNKSVPSALIDSGKITRHKSAPEHTTKTSEIVPKDSKPIAHKIPEVQYTKSEVDPFSTFSKSQPNPKSPVTKHKTVFYSKKVKDKIKLEGEQKKDKYIDITEKETLKKLKDQFSYFFPKSKSKEAKKPVLKEELSAVLIRKTKKKLAKSDTKLQKTMEEEDGEKPALTKAKAGTIDAEFKDKDRELDVSTKKKIQADMNELKRLQADLTKQKASALKSKMQQELNDKKAREAAEQKAKAEVQSGPKATTKSKVASVGPPLSKSLEEMTSNKVVKQPKIDSKGEKFKDSKLKAGTIESESHDKVVDERNKKKIKADLNEFKKLQADLTKQKAGAMKSKMQQELEEKKAREAAEQRAKTEAQYGLRATTKAKSLEEMTASKGVKRSKTDGQGEKIKAPKEKAGTIDSESQDKVADERTKKKIQADLNEFKRVNFPNGFFFCLR